MASTFRISDGTTTVDFLTDSAYRVLHWSPAVARRLPDAQAGWGLYEDVMEEMTLFIGGSSALDKLSKLQLLMDNADKFGRGESAAPVLIVYEAVGASSILTAVILGDTEIILPDNYPLVSSIQAIDPVILRFKRRGLWLDTTPDTSASASAAHPEVVTISSLTAVDADSPLDITIDGLDEYISWDHPFFILKGLDTTNLVIVEAENLASGAWTSVADSAADAKGNVLRYTPAGTTESGSASYSSHSLDSGVTLWGVFLNYRNNSGSTSFEVRVRIGIDIYTPTLFVPAGLTTPQWVFMGMAAVPQFTNEVLQVLCTASAASGSIDFDSIALIALDSPANGQVLEIGTGGPGYITLDDDFKVNGQLLSSLAPTVYRGSIQYTLAYRGSPLFILPAGRTSCAVALLATGPTISWRAVNGAGTPYSGTFTVSQSMGYVTLE
jgi:hypothetical protein